MDYTIVQYFYDKKCLPMELIQIILRYTYEPQASILLEDIRHYYCSLNEITEKYYNYFNEFEPGEHLNWLENNIVRYANNDRATNLGPHIKILDILDRSFMNLKLKALPIYKTRSLSVKTMINIFWGLFTIKERNEFATLYLVGSWGDFELEGNIKNIII